VFSCGWYQVGAFTGVWGSEGVAAGGGGGKESEL